MNDFSHNGSFRLPINIDEQKLNADLEICLRAQWKEHFNTRDYSGSWTAIALRSQSGNMEDIIANESDLPFADTSLMKECNYISEILEQLKCEKETVRLLRLEPGSVIKEHRDMGLAYRFGCFRLHIPIVTESAVAFIVGGKDIPMKKGECWYADFDLPHSVNNNSTKERIHLVIDGKRNAWTDEFFRSAGYDFEMEKKQLQPQYDEKTIDNMIENLERINTETSRKMISDLLERKKKLMASGKDAENAELLKGFVPSRLITDKKEIRFRWTYVGTKKFTEPFFSETLMACKSFPQNRRVVETSVQQLFDVSELADAVAPSAFIFHISRCGSTLLSQMLSMDKKCIVLSEAPLLDELLRLKYSEPDVCSEEFADRLFKASLRIYGQRANGNENHLFIKCDSWHTLFHERIRRCYPDVPVFLLYRSPIEVHRSQAKMPGMHAAPGVIDPSLFGFDPLPDSIAMNVYFGKVLESYFNAYREITEKDPSAFLMSYHAGAEAMLDLIVKHTGIAMDEKTRTAITERTRYHSKNPGQLFSEQQEEEPVPDWLLKANEVFCFLEQERTAIAKQV